MPPFLPQDYSGAGGGWEVHPACVPGTQLAPQVPCACTQTPGLCVPGPGPPGAHHSPLQQYGLYSAFMGCFVYFFLGTSRDVTLGPTAIMSLLVSFYTFHEPAYAVLLAFLSGCIQLAMGFLRLGEAASLLGRGGGSNSAFPRVPRPLGLAFPPLHSKGHPYVGV